MVTHNGNTKQHAVQIYDDLVWPLEPQTGRAYTMEELVADASLPLPESHVARLIRLRREHAADESLPPERLSLAEIRANEAARVQEVYLITSPFSAHVVRVSGSPSSPDKPALEYVLHFLSPPDYAEPQVGREQVIQLNQRDALAMIGMLAQAKAVMEDRTDEAGQPGGGVLAMGAVWASRL